MTIRWMGLAVTSSEVVVVAADTAKSGPMVIQADETWRLQGGSRPAAYGIIALRLRDFIKDNKIKFVRLKGSSPIRGVTQAHLDGAELRGVLAGAAVEAGADVEFVKKASLSRTFGSRNVDDYVSDESFFEESFRGKLRAGSREAALIMFAEASK